jgi:acyl dehydratase
MIDRSYLGYMTTPSLAVINDWRVKLFCQAIGETDQIYTDPALARSRGFRACPVPPTYLKAIEGDHCTSAAILKMLGVPLKGVLHAEQSFTHYSPVYVGDTLKVSRKIVDIYEKKNGAFTFIVVDSFYQIANEIAATSQQVILVRNALAP